MVEGRIIDRTFECRGYPGACGGTLILVDETFKMECLHCHRIDLISNPVFRSHVNLPPISLWQHLKVWWAQRRKRA
jgi:hypothetical protein